MPSSGYKIINQHHPHFLTFTAVGWADLFTRVEIRNIVIESLQYCQSYKGFRLNAYVIMSSHIHLIAYATEDGPELSSIVRDFKKFTSRKIIEWTIKRKGESRADWLLVLFSYHAKYNKNNAKYQVWQRQNRPKECVHPKFFRQKIGYIHLNPVTAKIVDRESDYIYSSARNYEGRSDTVLDVEIVDFGAEEGYIFG